MSLPLPNPDEHGAPFFDYCRDDELRMQRCAACKIVRHPPRLMCAECGSVDAEWMPLSGRGTIYSWIVSRQAVHPALTNLVPHLVVTVQLEEGPLLVSNMVDAGPDDVTIGMPVEVTFEAVGETVVLPRFRRRSA